MIDFCKVRQANRNTNARVASIGIVHGQCSVEGLLGTLRPSIVVIAHRYANLGMNAAGLCRLGDPLRVYRHIGAGCGACQQHLGKGELGCGHKLLISERGRGIVDSAEWPRENVIQMAAAAINHTQCMALQIDQAGHEQVIG